MISKKIQSAFFAEVRLRSLREFLGYPEKFRAKERAQISLSPVF
jgi:hypothetical protein